MHDSEPIHVPGPLTVSLVCGAVSEADPAATLIVGAVASVVPGAVPKTTFQLALEPSARLTLGTALDPVRVSRFVAGSYVAGVPEAWRDRDLVEAYHRLLEHPDPEIRYAAAARWTLRGSQPVKYWGPVKLWKSTIKGSPHSAREPATAEDVVNW